ncbi:hypothetical protein CMV_005208 [Castanea mollissima]|uniref:Uncharacterized protein n=1 Tax=Castanea mollissima TaxID=60419 RepID=A0A8J4VUQ8_9ROSI|nr:hypothetical protein CMV_005208 [Castanea mollissima]
MAFLLNKTSIASHFRSHSQVLRTSSLLDSLSSSFRSSNFSHSSRLPHLARGSRESPLGRGPGFEAIQIP